MDYEKAYKAALEWMRDVYPTLTGAAKEDAEHYFPELAESEDERMLNVAIMACKYMVDNFENSTQQYEDAIAYLEKQKEHATGFVEKWADLEEDEPVTDCSELEEEIERYIAPIHADEIKYEPFTSIEECARHFAKWGAEHLKK